MVENGDRAIGDDLVEPFLSWSVLRVHADVPLAGEDPFLVRVRISVRLQVLQDLIGVTGVAEAQIHGAIPWRDERVRMKIDDAGHRKPALEVDDSGLLADECPDFFGSADLQEATVPDGNSFRPRLGAVDRVDLAVVVDGVRNRLGDVGIRLLSLLAASEAEHEDTEDCERQLHDCRVAQAGHARPTASSNRTSLPGASARSQHEATAHVATVNHGVEQQLRRLP